MKIKIISLLGANSVSGYYPDLPSGMVWHAHCPLQIPSNGPLADTLHFLIS
jgi:hypothetical protein